MIGNGCSMIELMVLFYRWPIGQALNGLTIL
jgi:hypothetical protein